MDGFQWIVTDLASVFALPSQSLPHIEGFGGSSIVALPAVMQDWTQTGLGWGVQVMSVTTDVMLRVTVVLWAV